MRSYNCLFLFVKIHIYINIKPLYIGILPSLQSVLTQQIIKLKSAYFQTNTSIILFKTILFSHSPFTYQTTQKKPVNKALKTISQLNRNKLLRFSCDK